MIRESPFLLFSSYAFIEVIFKNNFSWAYHKSAGGSHGVKVREKTGYIEAWGKDKKMNVIPEVKRWWLILHINFWSLYLLGKNVNRSEVREKKIWRLHFENLSNVSGVPTKKREDPIICKCPVHRKRIEANPRLQDMME